jgi:antitoxin component of MazEF toxin-antitoxin module
MTLAHIARVEGMMALLLPQALLDKLGAQVGDEFDVALEGNRLIVRPRDEAEQIVQIDAILDDLFREREAVYRALAEGVE